MLESFGVLDLKIAFKHCFRPRDEMICVENQEILSASCDSNEIDSSDLPLSDFYRSVAWKGESQPAGMLSKCLELILKRLSCLALESSR